MSNDGNGHQLAIVIIDEILHETAREISEKKATGLQIAEAAGKQPSDEYYVLYHSDQGGLRELAQDDEIEVGHDGISRFYVIKGDRLYRFEIDGKEYAWPISPVLASVLYSLAGADPQKSVLWQEKTGGPAREIMPEDSIDLAQQGVEKFVLKPREAKHPTIFINDIEHVVKQDHLNGAQLRALGGIEGDYQLFLELPGNDIPIPNDKSVKIENGQHFYSLPPATFG